VAPQTWIATIEAASILVASSVIQAAVTERSAIEIGTSEATAAAIIPLG
jgi:hypothetical protein